MAQRRPAIADLCHGLAGDRDADVVGHIGRLGEIGPTLISITLAY
ncbi:MAG: hypothetical protein AAGJ94_04695 [Pseudomonadota bacterium]